MTERAPGVASLDDLTPTVETNDARRTFECAAHHRDPAVLAEMSDGLDTASRAIDVADGVRVEDVKTLDTFRRQVDVPVSREWRGRNEEDRLPHEPVGQPFVDPVVDAPHGQSPVIGRLGRGRTR
jgi:hypothetical protein